jgi:uncharacterized protein YndB with AHSA1/START domain
MNPPVNTAPSVRKTVTVEAPVQVAFDVFTAGIERWWPMASHHIGKSDCAAVVIEPWVGGRWFERGIDGTVCDWGVVQAWEPPHRVILVWQLNAQWEHEPALHTELEVRFTALPAGRTRVDLEHRGLDAYGELAETMHAALGSSNGWSGMLEHYARVAAT